MSQRPDLEIEKQKTRVWLKLLKVTRTLESELRDRLRIEFGTTLPRFDVLAALSRYPQGLKMSELSAVLKVSNGNVTGIIDRHVRDDLVVRLPVGGDKRAMKVKLTDAGESYFQVMAQSHSVWLDELLKGIDAADAQQLIALLGHIDCDKGVRYD